MSETKPTDYAVMTVISQAAILPVIGQVEGGVEKILHHSCGQRQGVVAIGPFLKGILGEPSPLHDGNGRNLFKQTGFIGMIHNAPRMQDTNARKISRKTQFEEFVSHLLQIKFNLRARAGLVVVDFHLLKLQLAVDIFFERLRLKFLEQLAVEIVGLGLHDAAALLVNPRDHARIAVRGRLRIRAFQDHAAASACVLDRKSVV